MQSGVWSAAGTAYLVLLVLTGSAIGTHETVAGTLTRPGTEVGHDVDYVEALNNGVANSALAEAEEEDEVASDKRTEMADVVGSAMVVSEAARRFKDQPKHNHRSQGESIPLFNIFNQYSEYEVIIYVLDIFLLVFQRR